MRRAGTFLDDPLLPGIGTSLATDHLGVLDEPLAVPDRPADIELVVEYPGAALLVPVDRRRAPGHAARP